MTFHSILKQFLLDINYEGNEIYYPLNVCKNNYFQNENLESKVSIDIETDVVKFDAGIISDKIPKRFTRTFTNNPKYKSQIDMFKSLEKTIQDFFDKVREQNEGNTTLNTNVDKGTDDILNTDDLRILIEQECYKNNFVPLINTVSYSQNDSWFVLNYKKKYDNDDFLIGEENLCFDFQKDDIWNINVEVVCLDDLDLSDLTENDLNIKNDQSNFYNFSDDFVNLKFNSSKVFLNKFKKENQIEIDKKKINCVFNLNRNKLISGEKIGMKECLEKQVLINIPKKYLKENIPVFVFRQTFSA